MPFPLLYFMPESGQSVYLVSTDGDPVRLVIKGRASYTNCGPLQQFFERVTSEGKAGIVIDFAECSGMDSTFMGLLAGAAIQIKQRAVPGEITLKNLSSRNQELIRNLGLHRLLKVCENTGPSHPGFPVEKLSSPDGSIASAAPASQETILKAHEDLMKADPANVAKFQDVVAFLKRDNPPRP